MAKEFSKWFYDSIQWRKTRSAYIKHVYGLCERCGNTGKVVHHKIKLTPDNINDMNILLSFDNLELLCQDCHNKEHHYSIGGGIMFDANGDVIPPIEKCDENKI